MSISHINITTKEKTNMEEESYQNKTDTEDIQISTDSFNVFIKVGITIVHMKLCCLEYVEDDGRTKAELRKGPLPR